MIESCDNKLNNSNNSDNEAEDVVAVLDEANSDKVKEKDSHMNGNGLASEVADKLVIEMNEDKANSEDNYKIDGSSKGCNVEVAEVNTGSNRNSVELKVN